MQFEWAQTRYYLLPHAQGRHSHGVALSGYVGCVSEIAYFHGRGESRAQVSTIEYALEHPTTKLWRTIQVRLY